MRPPLYSSLHFHHHIHIIPPLIETREGSRPTSTAPLYNLSIFILGVQAFECSYHFHHRLSLFRSLMGEKPTSLRTLPNHWILRLLGFSIAPSLTSSTASFSGREAHKSENYSATSSTPPPLDSQASRFFDSTTSTPLRTRYTKKAHSHEISPESGLTASGLRSRQ